MSGPIALNILSPVAGSLVLPTETDIVIVIDDDIADPTRTLNVTVNAVLVFTAVADVATFVAPGYAAVVDVSTPNTAIFTITDSTPWADPSALSVVATYQAQPAPVPAITATSNAVAGLVLLSPASPYNQQPDASVRTSISFTLFKPVSLTVQQFTLLINGASAVSGAIPGTQTLAAPNFSGAISYSPTVTSFFIDPRRYFDHDTRVTVALQLEVQIPGPYTGTKTLTYDFYTPPLGFGITDPAVVYSVADLPFIGSPALEAIRYLLKGALQGPNQTTPYVVLLAARVLRSSLKGAQALFRVPEYAGLTEKLRPQDLISPVEVLAALESLDVLWASAIKESKSAGVDEDTLKLLEVTYAAEYPQERLAAYCGLILLNLPA